MRSHINHDLLPILTEKADGTVLDLPTLTDAVNSKTAAGKRPFPLNDEQCRQLAEQLFPELEAKLREAIGSRSEARWKKAMQQVRAALPDLISDTVKPR
ncbi:MAG: hypothetical protein HY799_06670 [Nitrosomonadales bacterium]|nr:hypothetical protein [Nitrosomonadales bacterium]